MGSEWSAVSWYGNQLPSILAPGEAISTANTQVGAVRSALSPAIDTSSEYVVEMYIVPYAATFAGDYVIFARMDNSSPDATNEGIYITLTMTGTTQAWTGSLIDYTGGSGTTYTFTPGTGTDPSKPGWLRVFINGDNITITWQGTTVINAQAVTSHSGTRVGFGMKSTVAGATSLCGGFRVQYYDGTTIERRRTIRVASSNGELWRETYVGVMAKLTTNLTLESDRTIESAERLQKLYIADRGDLKASGTDGVRGTANNTFDSPSYADWTTLSLNNYDYTLTLTNSTGDLIDGTYTISGVAAGELTLATNCASGATGTASFRVERGPKIYDPVADTLTMWTATSGSGDVPQGCSEIELYRDRMFLSKEQAWFGSKSGDPLDWDYSQTDALAAVASTNSDAGRIGEPIVSMKAYHDQYLIFGCRSSVWMLRGDPKLGGMLGPISQDVGTVDVGALTPTSESVVVFLSHAGLFQQVPGGANYPTPLSDEKIPEELKGLSWENHSIRLIYDSINRGIHIFVSPNTGNSARHYWYDWRNKAFFRDTWSNSFDPTQAIFYRSDDPSQNAVILGCRDGYIRSFRDSANTDDGNEIVSYVDIGPFALGGNDYFEGKFRELDGILDENSGTISLSVRKGDTAEATFRASDFWTGTWNQNGRQYTKYPEATGAYAILRLTNADNTPWALEGIHVRVERQGKPRLA
jgi:hypothetical protein